jgi:peroxiredoxin
MHIFANTSLSKNATNSKQNTFTIYNLPFTTFRLSFTIYHLQFVIALLLGGLNTALAQTHEQPTDRGYIVKVGDKVKNNLIITYPDGTSTTLKKLKGKVVMLQFTASWCGVCRAEMPHIETDIWQAYKDKGLVLIGVDYKENAETTAKFAETMNITYPLALDLDAAIFKTFAREDSGVTRNVLINRKGKIVFLTRLYDTAEFANLVAAIDKQFK